MLAGHLLPPLFVVPLAIRAEVVDVLQIRRTGTNVFQGVVVVWINGLDRASVDQETFGFGHE
jgi:hypothetical protein